jgi:hypothetical protein
MGKRIEDLHLDDNPIEQQHDQQEARQQDLFSAEIPDERDTPWYRFCGEIDDLLAAGGYHWAQDTLLGIRETVEKSRRVTDGQKRAVANIERAKEEPRRSSRRYEGWEKRGGW